ncbi:glycoside hydrolase family 13 protein [Suillus clintonianus]|uniref:glycoside hydrolase family 13 protein n=1 Tax=Suillus clintonianus TaxID=1904413 RepID=UPI001B85B387|nr:glycoside hydrolase family 13 protein [Suillus clintonianus]KAG2149365.1 glycoside hydrolase family 13 protein [Suillus clintonianus]
MPHAASLAAALLTFVLPLVYAATSDQWRGRSIYQVIIDRYALPEGADPNQCPPGDRTYCGGTWNSLRQNLDYIQDAGFTAVWISPVSQNYEGPTTPYGDPYHGYWIADATKLNSHFGTSDDLKALSTELHRRGMYLMVDVVINDVMATSITPDLSTYMFKEQSQYHPYCVIDWSNTTSEEQCWLGDTVVPLPDLNTEDPTVVAGFGDWIQDLVQEYKIDGLRIDAAKHINMGFLPVFCGKAGVFCIGEVFGSDIDGAAIYQGPDALDSILNYPMYTALLEAFTIPGPQNTSAVTNMIAQEAAKFKDPTLLGNFIENQDISRWANLSTDPQTLYNAMVFNFMTDGIPIVYYGQEQGFSGSSDPYNREAMWPSKYANTTTYQLISTLNKFRNFLVNTTQWATTPTQVLTTSPYGIATLKGDAVSIMTNIGSPPQNISIPVYTPYLASTSLTNVLTCQQWPVGSNGTIDAQYSLGGVPLVLYPTVLLQNSGLCGNAGSIATGATKYASGALHTHRPVISLLTLLSSSLLGFLSCFL